MKKIFGIIAVVAIFVVSIYLVLKIPKSVNSDVVQQDLSSIPDDSEEWLGIFLQGQRIGYSFTKIFRSDTGLTVENRTQMTLMMMNEPRSVTTHVFGNTDKEYALKDFVMDIQTQGHESRIEGRVEDKRLELTVYSQGVAHTQTITLKEKPYLPAAIEEVIKKRKLTSGDEITIPYFDPTTQSSTHARIKVLDKEMVDVFGKEIFGTRVEISVMGLNEIVWFDDNYKLIKRSSPAMGMEMIPLPREEALADIEPADAFDLLSFVSVKPDKPILNTANISFLELELKNITIEGLDLDDDYQKLISKEPIVVEFYRPDLSELPDLVVPIDEHQELLEPSVYIQCRDPEIIAKADELVGGEKEAKKIVALLVVGVYKLLKKNPVASLPSAIDVLRTKEGDCNEHSILFAALARAKGIPTKVYVGLVNIQGFAYFYHAWCAVWLGKWVPVDPTFNQYPADVGHLKLKEGEVSEWANVLKVVGNLDISVRDVQ